MRPPPLAAAILVAAFALPSSAAEPPAKPELNRVDMNKAGLPVVWRGRLVNYVFVTVRVKVAPGRDAEALRAREPYLRDALVRLAHRTSFTDPADLARVDAARLSAAFLPEARRVAGPGVVTAVEVTAQQPRRRPPRPGPERPAGRSITP